MTAALVEPEGIDPDPFTVGLALFSAVAGGGAFLEARRQRALMQVQQRNSFRAAWYEARRTLIHFTQQVDEFETYMIEDGYARAEFRIGAVRLSVDRYRHQALRRLRGQALTTARYMGDNLDDLSEHLGPEHQVAIEAVLSRVDAMRIPETYRGVVTTAREAIAVYSDLLDHVASEEGFERLTPV